MTKERKIQTFTIDWQGIALSVSYETRWLDLESANVAHLEVRSDGRVRLPITETGYRSHFLSPEAVTAAGGPVAYALAWLDYMAQSKEWKAHAEASRQLNLF
ncbi:MAG: hypothetical protein Q8L23_01070 [Caulobacter sp.]|nr:hypothetical protein [Caulobacter sp.]